MQCNQIKELSREKKEIIFLISWNLIFNKSTFHFYFKWKPFFIGEMETNFVGIARSLACFIGLQSCGVALSLYYSIALTYYVTKSTNPERLLH